MDITKANRDISELNPVAQKACKLFLEECKKAGLDIFITETFRPQARQDYLYAQGRTRPGNIVTWTRSSNHTGRMAWDIAVNKPKDLYDTATLKKAGEIAKKLGITWGGTWKGTPDTPHFEVTANWKAPVQSGSTDTEKEEIRMFKPSTNTLKNEYIKMLEDAYKAGILSSKTWIDKAKKDQLSLDDAVALIAVIRNRSK